MTPGRPDVVVGSEALGGNVHYSATVAARDVLALRIEGTRVHMHTPLDARARARRRAEHFSLMVR